MKIYNLLKNDISQNELLYFNNASIKYKFLPAGINGFIFVYRGIFVIIINKYLSFEMKQKTLLHELAHIELNQLEQYNLINVEEYEIETDMYIKLLFERL